MGPPPVAGSPVWSRSPDFGRALDPADVCSADSTVPAGGVPYRRRAPSRARRRGRGTGVDGTSRTGGRGPSCPPRPVPRGAEPGRRGGSSGGHAARRRTDRLQPAPARGRPGCRHHGPLQARQEQGRPARRRPRAGVRCCTPRRRRHLVAAGRQHLRRAPAGPARRALGAGRRAEPRDQQPRALGRPRRGPGADAAPPRHRRRRPVGALAGGVHERLRPGRARDRTTSPGRSSPTCCRGWRPREPATRSPASRTSPTGSTCW